MIARIWRGTTVADRTTEYLEYVRETGLAEYAAPSGYRGVRVLQRTDDGLTQLTVISFWDSIEAIRAFAGNDAEVAHYYPADDEYLVERDERVEHHEVVELD